MTIEERKTLVDECRKSGMSARAWCREKGIAQSTYCGWAKRFPVGACEEARDAKSKQWLRVKLTTDVLPSFDKEKNIEVSCGKWSINIPDDTKFDYMSNVLRAVNELCS